MKFKPLLLAGLLAALIPKPVMADFFAGMTAYIIEDYATAIKEFTLSSQEGHASAQFYLGIIYAEGRGVAQDYKQAIYWYEQAAKAGDASAQNNLGVMYNNGQGTAQDLKQAAYWYEQAAKQGIDKSQFILGVMYNFGRGVSENYKQAVYWYKQAARQGHTDAQNNLGVMYANGEGVLQDYIQAHKWFNIASANGHETARKNRDEWVAPKMTPTQIQQAQAMARAFLTGETTPTQAEPEKPVVANATTGTGFIISKSGELVTNAHVVQNCKTIDVELGKQTLAAQIIAMDNNNDMAILKTNHKAAPASVIIGRVALGQTIYAAGYPLRGLLGQDLQITNGIISGLNGIQNDYRYYQINAAVQSGNSGGPLLSEQGHVLGIVSMKLNVTEVEKLTGDLPQNVNFAIKSSQLVGFLDANQLDYQIADRGKSLTSTEIAERARNFTAFVTCYQ